MEVTRHTDSEEVMRAPPIAWNWTSTCYSRIIARRLPTNSCWLTMENCKAGTSKLAIWKLWPTIKTWPSPCRKYTLLPSTIASHHLPSLTDAFFPSLHASLIFSLLTMFLAAFWWFLSFDLSCSYPSSSCNCLSFCISAIFVKFSCNFLAYTLLSSV